jgi:hypothetical protein
MLDSRDRLGEDVGDLFEARDRDVFDRKGSFFEVMSEEVMPSDIDVLGLSLVGIVLCDGLCRLIVGQKDWER